MHLSNWAVSLLLYTITATSTPIDPQATPSATASIPSDLVSLANTTIPTNGTRPGLELTAEFFTSDDLELLDKTLVDELLQRCLKQADSDIEAHGISSPARGVWQIVTRPLRMRLETAPGRPPLTFGLRKEYIRYLIANVAEKTHYHESFVEVFLQLQLPGDKKQRLIASGSLGLAPKTSGPVTPDWLPQDS